MEENKAPDQTTNDLNTLEEQDTTVTATPEPQVSSSSSVGGVKKGPISKIVSLVSTRFNIYLLIFVLILIVSAIVVFIALQAGRREDAATTIEVQELTQEAIDNLTSNEATVGDPKQLLSVESNAVFAGKVLIRDSLDVAGAIKVGGALSLPGITVSGTSQFDDVQVNSLSIAGDTNVQGLLTVQNSLTVSGQANFGGSISAAAVNTDVLQINGDLTFGRHIDAGGGSPTVVGGGGIGSGGTVSVSGTDTAGTVTVNVGSGAGGGVLATVNFAVAFNGNPHVVFTPVTQSAALAGASYYLISRTTSGFTIASTGPLSPGSISFDYIVID